MIKKKTIFIILFIFIIILTTIFLDLYYKKQKKGNTIFNKSEEQIIDSILNMKAYEATLDITIKTNKNETKYKLNQILKEGKAKQEVLEPKNISGVITQYDGNNLKIINNKLDLETTFQNYQYIVKNRLWLDSFVEDYKKEENKKKNLVGNEIILELSSNKDIYNYKKELHIDKNTGKPTKLIIKDINKNMLVYILYTEITIS